MCAAVCDRAEQQLGIDAIGAANCSDRPSMISVHNRHMESGTRKYLQPCDNQSRGTPRFPVHQVKLERGNPHSVYYKSRKKHAPNPTNAQIDAAETGVPASVDHPNRNVSPTIRPTPRSTRPRREIRPASITGRIRKRFSRRSGGAIACARSSEPGEAARVAVAASSSARSLSGGRRVVLAFVNDEKVVKRILEHLADLVEPSREGKFLRYPSWLLSGTAPILLKGPLLCRHSPARIARPCPRAWRGPSSAPRRGVRPLLQRVSATPGPRAGTASASIARG